MSVESVSPLLVHFPEVALLLDHRGLLPVSPDHLGEEPDIGAEEGEALKPDEHEGVVTLELQHVGRQQPRALGEPPQHDAWENNSTSFQMDSA